MHFGGGGGGFGFFIFVFGVCKFCVQILSKSNCILSAPLGLPSLLETKNEKAAI